jgi:hypothetical protein
VHADLQRLLSDDLLANTRSHTMERLRSIRVELNTAEGDVSFVRRVTQGRLDIVGHEVARRSNPDTESSEVGAGVNDLLFDMPDILTDDRSGNRGANRPVTVGEPGPIAEALLADLDSIASPSQLSGVATMAQGDLADLLDSLRQFEIDLSSARRSLHDRIDGIQEEIARRYRDGEASIDALLS